MQKIFGTVLLCLTTSWLLMTKADPDIVADCIGKPADVVFALDTSNSIWKPDFQRQLEFVKEVVGLFTIGHRSQRVGVMTYAEHPQLQFHLNYYYRKSDIKDAIGNIKQDGGYQTRTSEALRYMRETCFHSDSGARPDTIRIGIVITDGLSLNSTMTAEEARKTRDAGINLFAVGVGRNLDIEELKVIASQPTDFHVLMVESYAGLNNIRNLLAIKTCTATNPPTTTVAATTTTQSTTTFKRTQTTLRLAKQSKQKQTKLTTQLFPRITKPTPSTTTTTAATTTRTWPRKQSTVTIPMKRTVSTTWTTSELRPTTRLTSASSLVDLRRTKEIDNNLEDKTELRKDSDLKHGNLEEQRQDGNSRINLGHSDGNGYLGKTTSSLYDFLSKPTVQFQTGKYPTILEYPKYIAGENENPNQFQELQRKDDSIIHQNPGSYRSEVSGVNQKYDTNSASTTEVYRGYWGRDADGKDVYYLYIRPGVYDKIYPEEADAKPQNEEKTNTDFWGVDENGNDVYYQYVGPPDEYKKMYYSPPEQVEATNEDGKSYWDIDEKGQQVYYRYVPPGHYEKEYPGQMQTTTTALHNIAMLDSRGLTGYWDTTKKGKKVWYQYVCPGVYEEVDSEKSDILIKTHNNATRVETTEKPGCLAEDENGKEAWFSYVSPGKFEKIDPTLDTRRTPTSTNYDLHQEENFQEFRGKEEGYVHSSDSSRTRQEGPTEYHETDFFSRILVFDQNGKPVREIDALPPGMEPLPMINPDDLIIEDEKIWTTLKNGSRNLVGCIINGTHYIGRWIEDDDCDRLWYGYPLIGVIDNSVTELPLFAELQLGNYPTNGLGDGDYRSAKGRLKKIGNAENGIGSNIFNSNTMNKIENELDKSDDDESSIKSIPLVENEDREEVVDERTIDSESIKQNIVGNSRITTTVQTERKGFRTDHETDDQETDTVVIVVDSTGKVGHWTKDDEGQDVWYRYTCPGTYEIVPENERDRYGHSTCSGLDEDGKQVWYSYTGPGKFEKMYNNDVFKNDVDERIDKDEIREARVVSPEGHDSTPPGSGRSAVEKVDSQRLNPRISSKLGILLNRTSNSQKKFSGCRPRRSLDIVFAIDSKSKVKSVARDVWEVPHDVISEINMEENRVRVRFVHECAALAELDMTQFLDKNTLLNTIDKTGPMSSAQLLDAMTDAMKDEGEQNNEPHIRSDDHVGDERRQKVGVYITDGQSGDIEATIKAAQRARFEGDIEVFVIGVGYRVNPTELKAIASCDVDQHFFSIRGHSKPAVVSRKLSKILCQRR